MPSGNPIRQMTEHAKTGVSSTVLVFLDEVWSSPLLILTVYSLTLANFRVFMCDSKIDILLINETKLDSTFHDSDAYIPGFEIIRKGSRVNGRKGGGVCIYLRTKLSYQIRDDLIK